MILIESNERIINLYNKLTNTNKGKEVISNLSKVGIPDTYFEWAVKCIVNEGIPNYILKYTYEMWKKHVIPYFADSNTTPLDMRDITHEKATKTINKALKYYTNYSEVFNDGKTSIITIKTFHHANLLPKELRDKWCICNMEDRFNEFLPQSGAYLLIKTPSLCNPYKYVIAIVDGDNIEYWDENNQRMSYISSQEEARLIEYEQMLSDDAVYKINRFNIIEGKDSKNNRIRITKQELKQNVSESIKRVLGGIL
jgi:hypothetical protein